MEGPAHGRNLADEAAAVMRKVPGPNGTEGTAERMLVNACPTAVNSPRAGHDLSYRSSFLGDPGGGKTGADRDGASAP